MAINSLGYNTQRISGLFSGMDTQSLVESMLAADQAKVDNIFRQQEKAQWKLDAYSELNTSVSSLRNTYLSVLGEKSLIKNAAYNSFSSTNFTALTGNVTADHRLMDTLRQEQYDLVLVNIVADVIIGLSPVLPQLLSSHSTLICSGILDTRLEDVVAALRSQGLTITSIRAKEDWRCITAKKE